MNSKKIFVSAVAVLIGLGISGFAQSAPVPDKEGHNDIYFKPVAAPVTDKQKKQILTSSEVNINGSVYPIGWHTIARTGQKLPGLNGKSTEVFGMVRNEAGEPIKHRDGSEFVCRTSKKGSGAGPDHTTLHEAGGSLFAITQFECAPATMYISKLEKSREGGLKAVATSHISQADYHGGWLHCAGMKTPWGSHLGSEEYEPDAKKVTADNLIDEKKSYYNNTALFFKDGQTHNNPYYYGWIPEVHISNAKGDTDYVKHYSMGRFSHELAYVMPDEKTVYLSDDGTNGVLYMFIADKKAVLSSGTLYAAKLKQHSDKNGGVFDVSWINLGHASDSELKSFIDNKPGFSDLLEAGKPNDGKCETGFTSINTTWGQECLKVKPGMDKYASRLESRRYAAIKGATTEFRKKEGITLDKQRSALYVAISRIQYGMEDFMKQGKPEAKYDIGSNNDIKLPRNDCGGIYKMDISNGMMDSSGVMIGSSYVAANFKGELFGEMKEYPKGSEFDGNKCSINAIAEPDNLAFINNSDILLIGEDTGAHQIDYLWAYNVVTKDLTRILTTPYGSETTSPFWYQNIGGNAYITTIIQHPFGESDKDKASGKQELESWIGVIGPFPAFH